MITNGERQKPKPDRFSKEKRSVLEWSFFPFLLWHHPKALAKRTRKSTHVYKTGTCVRTYEGWPNGFASRLESSRKSQKVVNSMHIQLTCVGWPSVDLRTNLSSTKVHPSHRKWVGKRNASWTQVENLRRLASPFGQGLNKLHVKNIEMWNGFA